MTETFARKWIENRCKEFGLPVIPVVVNLTKIERGSGYGRGGYYVRNGKTLGQHWRTYWNNGKEESEIRIFHGANRLTLKHEFVHYLRAERRKSWHWLFKKFYVDVLSSRWEEIQTYKMEKWPMYSLKHWFHNSWGI